jgi:hypothetical protein
MWHAHVGGIFRPKPLDLNRYVKDLDESHSLRIVNRLFFCGLRLA